ncbi:MAG: nucleotidyltransferase domain-containing protein [Caldilineaceae bacterium]
MAALNQATHEFVTELQRDPNVLGIILFGSWARGNNRPTSDVDLVVILREGYRRAVEYRQQQAFEIIYITVAAALDYWTRNLDDSAGLWSVAEILFDRDGTTRDLQAKVEALLQAGKPAIAEAQLGQRYFDVEDRLRYVAATIEQDPSTAHFVLTGHVLALTELFFDLKQRWTPAPKQRLAAIRTLSPEFYELLQAFYQDASGVSTRLELARKMVTLVWQDFPNITTSMKE